MAALDTTTAPAWATPYVPGSVSDWRLWREPTMRGMMADLGPRHPGWTAHWWTDLRTPSPAGADNDTWFLVSQALLPATDLRPYVQFGSWDYCDAHMHRVAGAPLRIAGLSGLWRDGNGAVWQFCGADWLRYDEWCQPQTPESAWHRAARGAGLRGYGALPEDEEAEAERLADTRRRDRGWGARSAILARLPEDHRRGLLRHLRGGIGSGRASAEDYRAWRIEDRAEALCWARATDDLPWSDVRPAVARPTPQSLFAEVTARG